ncbi:hypothetical protein MBAV_001180 [Candidatus Magnetobacterium bavaricum]|uniref:Uncharacterized protein n=1 Tax=Candidatus Magnetobacterium bavaricum TaxID=29290 RepID=A0A0F3GXK3_9BACT|nr:hypothetical protein MBAV_001180 [Candidatus Magnetobacterium bavaricum]
MGVLPVAIRTIIVSPTALERPIITAENMPAAAAGNTTFTTVCHLLAPNAREADTRFEGTFDIASSAIVKIIGMTAKLMAYPTIRQLRWS